MSASSLHRESTDSLMIPEGQYELLTLLYRVHAQILACTLVHCMLVSLASQTLTGREARLSLARVWLARLHVGVSCFH